jgi:hypothetical protein
MQAIVKLSGQEYVDIDARRAKADLARGAEAGHGQVGDRRAGHHEPDQRERDNTD